MSSAAGVGLIAGCLALAAPALARADEDSKAARESTQATAHDIATDTSRTGRADLPARLADPDTSYGRVDGDVGFVVGVGAAISGTAPRGSAELRLRYLDTAGIFATYEDAFGEESAGATRVIAAGLEVRPLFLGRWVTGKEVGVRWPDLIIDSFGLDLGAFFQEAPGVSFGSRPGLQAGFALEIPLIGRPSGPWIDIHADARWSEEALEGEAVQRPSDRAFVVTFSVAYHQLFRAHLVDLHDRAP